MSIRISTAILTLGVILSLFAACQTSRAKSSVEMAAVPRDTLSYRNLGQVKGKEIVVRKTVDLRGRICNLPEGYSLVFKDGVIKNGILNGNKTKIEHCKKAIFDHILIKGSWDVADISSKMFKDLHYINAVRNVVAMACGTVHNRIVIEKGIYPVSVQHESETCLLLEDNTELVLNGTIQLTPNSFKNYYIMTIAGENTTVSGCGTIIGDKSNHTAKEGEWGMGIYFRGATNATVKGLTIKDCWGDCIYVGGDSRNVNIENCLLDNGRRQGISVTKADYVIIRNCTIKNISGTDPEYAIDIEPNIGCRVDHVLIENVVAKNCEGGFVVSKGNHNTEQKEIGEVTIRNCTVIANSKYPIRFERCDKAILENCVVYDNQENTTISSIRAKDVTMKNNKIIKKSGFSLLKRNNQMMKILWAERENVINNEIVQQ